MKILAVIAVCFTTTVLANSAEVDVKQCAWGESFWCSSLRAAKACGAFNHCKTTIWKNQKLKEDSSDICQFCESIVGDVYKFISDNETAAEIQKFLTMACGIIPDQTMASECKDIVSFYVHDIIALIIDQTNPQAVCSLIGVCAGLEDSVKHSPILSTVEVAKPAPSTDVVRKIPQKLNVNAEPICTDCKKFFGDIKSMIIANATVAQVEQLIDSTICALLGSEEGECKALVHEFLPELMEIIASYYDPNLICQSLGVCNADLPQAKNFLINYRLKKLPLYRAAKESSTAVCIVCKSVMSELQVLDREKTVQSELIATVKTELCARLGSLKVECEITVDMYAPELFELIATELDPTTRCRSLGFCSPVEQSRDPVREFTPAVKPQPNLRDAGCIMCEWVITEVVNMITANATEAEIIAALDKVCSYLPTTVASECKSFVDTYGPTVIAMLVAETDPATVCTLIGLCKASELASPQLPIKVGNGETCLVCETIVQYLESLLEQNTSIAEIEAIMNKICNFVPEAMKGECQEIVNKYGPLIINYITTMKSPEEICTLVGACAAKTGPVRMAAILQPVRREVKPAVVDEPLIIAKKQPMLGVNKCTWGPAYWCASSSNANECNAVAHCKRTNWQTK